MMFCCVLFFFFFYNFSITAYLLLPSGGLSHAFSSFQCPFVMFSFFFHIFSSCFLFLPLFLSERSAPPLAPVDTSMAAFDIDPLDLDAEEPPESQGDPRSPKGVSGSVTSPQANAHRLPFFKKVTLSKTPWNILLWPPSSNLPKLDL